MPGSYCTLPGRQSPASPPALNPPPVIDADTPPQLRAVVTAPQYLVLCELGRFDACRLGIFPSHEFLARRARCSVRTVQRALEAARALGLVDWSHQRVRAA